MGKRELKKQYKELEFNFVDLVSLLDTTSTKKLTPFLVKQFNDWIQYTGNEEMNDSYEYSKMTKTLGDPKNELDEIIKRMVFKWAQPKLDIINEFTEHLENNRLGEKDINKYDNWNAVKLAINDADIKRGLKSKKNKIMILHQDEEWLILKPLSLEASINYGYGTKWCTSMRDSNTYFHRYSRDGVLVFVINRKNGVKYAIYSSPKEYSVWTATDARIDSMETTIPFELLGKMKSWTNFDEVGPNYNYFDEEDKNDGKKKLAILRSVGIESDEAPRPEDPSRIEASDEEEGDMTATNDMRNVTISFTADEFSNVTEEAEEVMDESSDEMEVSVDIRDRSNDMVGYGHSVHGSITEQGERTWESPYPNGPGGGFEPDMEVESELTEAQWESVIPANEEAAEAMEDIEVTESEG